MVPLNLRFPHQRVIFPHSRLSAKYIIVTHIFTNDNLTDRNSPSYQNQNVQKHIIILRITINREHILPCGLTGRILSYRQLNNVKSKWPKPVTGSGVACQLC